MDKTVKNEIESLEVFYFDTCPSWKETLRNLRESLKELKIPTRIQLIRIETNEAAVFHQFPGSPTIKANGKDIFPTQQKNYALGCRVYKTHAGFLGSPTKEMISEKLSKIINK